MLIGGIGIMNIMLASVTERTKEIGIRRAIGAKRKQIIGQFLIETVVLSVTGGFVGIGMPVGSEGFGNLGGIETEEGLRIAEIVGLLRTGLRFVAAKEVAVEVGIGLRGLVPR